jgi:hypothetical protein
MAIIEAFMKKLIFLLLIIFMGNLLSNTGQLLVSSHEPKPLSPLDIIQNQFLALPLEHQKDFLTCISVRKKSLEFEQEKLRRTQAYDETSWLHPLLKIQKNREFFKYYFWPNRRFQKSKEVKTARKPSNSRQNYSIIEDVFTNSSFLLPT